MQNVYISISEYFNFVCGFIFRTLFDAIQDSEGIVGDEHRDFVSMLLEKELQAYKAAR